MLSEETTTRAAVNRDFYNLDTLISELNVPKEEIAGSEHSASQIHSDDSDFYTGDPDHGMAPEIASLSGKTIAGTIDTVFATGMGLYARSSAVEKYEASDKQLDRLSDAWAAVAAKYNFRMEDSPWFNVIALTAGVYIPKFQEAKIDRLRNEFERTRDEMKSELSEIKSEIDSLKRNREKETE